MRTVETIYIYKRKCRKYLDTYQKVGIEVCRKPTGVINYKRRNVW